MQKPVAKKIKSALKSTLASRPIRLLRHFAAAYGIASASLVVLMLAGIIIAGGYSRSPDCTTSPFKNYAGAVEQLVLDDKAYLVAFAQTAEQKSQGLSNTACLPSDNAMLFDYAKQPELAAFWMKDMYYSIDIIWLDADGRIITLAKRVTPESYPQTFQPVSPASYVLEVVAGESDRQGWREGDKIMRL